MRGLWVCLSRPLFVKAIEVLKKKGRKVRIKKMSNSSLISYTKLSPNHSGQRTHSVDRITPHCVVGQLLVKAFAVASQARTDKQVVTTVSVQMGEFLFVWMKETVLGVLPAMPTISGQSRLNALLIKLNRMQ